jgi:hypothetical protein
VRDTAAPPIVDQIPQIQGLCVDDDVNFGDILTKKRAKRMIDCTQEHKAGGNQSTFLLTIIDVYHLWKNDNGAELRK